MAELGFEPSLSDSNPSGTVSPSRRGVNGGIRGDGAGTKRDAREASVDGVG